MVIAVGDAEHPSRRTVAILAGSIAALFVLLVVGSVALQGSGSINGQNEIATVGQPISIRVDNDLDIRVDMTVTEVSLVSAGDADDTYLVRYAVSGIDEIAPATSSDLWRLVDDEGAAYVASDPAIAVAADCNVRIGTDRHGCVIITVPAGTVVTMVRYYGVKTFWYQGKPTAREVWAGWAA